MPKESTAEKHFENIIKIISELPSDQKKIMADKLISYLLFEDASASDISKNELLKHYYPMPSLSNEDLHLIKELALRTENLKNLLGEDPYFFM